MKFIIIIPVLLLAISCIKSADTSQRIPPMDVDADYCLDLRSKPKARLVKKYRDLESALISVPGKQNLKCQVNEYYYFYFFEKERDWLFPITSSMLCAVAGSIGGSGTDSTDEDDGSACTFNSEISPVVQIDFPESEIIDFINFEGEELRTDYLLRFKDTKVDEEIHKKEDLLLFKNKIIDVEIYKDIFLCSPRVDTTISVIFRARITGECENMPELKWNVEATSDDSVVAELLPGGTLIIKGKGKMMDFDKHNNRPWGKICAKEISKIVIENGVTHIGKDAFLHCKLASVTIPGSVISKGDYAFAYSGLDFDDINILGIVASFGKSTFHRGGLISIATPDSTTSIIIPEKVDLIERKKFSDFKNLTSITILSPYPPSLYVKESWLKHERAFEGVNKDACTLHVPKGSVDAYRKADGWKDFKNIEPME